MIPLTKEGVRESGAPNLTAQEMRDNVCYENVVRVFPAIPRFTQSHGASKKPFRDRCIHFRWIWNCDIYSLHYNSLGAWDTKQRTINGWICYSQ